MCFSGYTDDGFDGCVRNAQNKEPLSIGVGVAIAGLALACAAVMITIIVLVYQNKKNKQKTSQRVAYLPNVRESLLSNAAYTATSDQNTTNTSARNEAYIVFSINEANGNVATTIEENNITTAVNDPYVCTEVFTFPNQAYQTANESNDSFDHTYEYVS